MKQIFKTCIYACFSLVLLSSCSITRTRYNRGLHIEFPWSAPDQPAAKPGTKDAAWKQKEIPGSEARPSLPTSTVPPDSLGASPATIKTTGFRKSDSQEKPDRRVVTLKHGEQTQERLSVHQPLTPGQDEESHTSVGLGIAGFVLSFFAWFWPVGIMAIVFSGIGLSGGRPYKGLALSGLIIGIVFSLIGIRYLITV